jgi:predicted GIY-YIG superfamily endonuclease
MTITLPPVDVDLVRDLDALTHSLELLSFTPTTDLATAVLEAARAGTERRARLGTVYLLHFNRPYRHARHYTGWTTDLDARLAQHIVGAGARLIQVIEQAGIDWTLARTWPGTRNTERALKRQGGASRRCPLCGIKPRHITGGH